jgi:hypothetical protein
MPHFREIQSREEHGKIAQKPGLPGENIGGNLWGLLI